MVAVMRQSTTDESSKPAQARRTKRIATIPNIICVLRILGSILLLRLAILGHCIQFLWLFVALAISDWLDGKLAILLNQRSELGPRLDSWADFSLYAALFWGILILSGNSLASEWGWIASALISYTLATCAALWRYHCWPSYHTRSAKTAWFLILVGAISLLADYNAWPLRIALIAVVMANLESLLITVLSPIRRDDVGSVLQVLRERSAR
jgi:phosphatidylglycerophosphate synthase